MQNWGGSYWGLTRQIGPWRENRQDKRNAKNHGSIGIGGGVPGGGTANAGAGNWFNRMNPAYRNGPLPAPPRPSQYVRSVSD